MDKYVIAPPNGSTQNSVGAADRKWKAGYFEKLPNWQEYLAESTGYGIVSGCTPTISGLTVTVGAGIVHLADGTRKELSATNITLDAADSTNPRIDLVYIDSTGAVAKITGTAAASPVVPSMPSGGISVAQVSVVANATVGAVTDMRGMLARWYNTQIISVKDFGIIGDGTTDNKFALRKLTDYLNKNNGGYVIFPKGRYVSTETLVVPGNTIIDFCESLFYLSQYSASGEAIMVCGNGVIIRNVEIDYYGSNVVFDKSGPNNGALGVGNYTYASFVKFLDDNTSTLVTEDRKNVLIENLYTVGSYATQVEDRGGNKITNVVLRNIIAPNGFISVLPYVADSISKIVYENVDCDGFRLGKESLGFDVTLKNIRTKNGRCTSPGFTADNLQLVTDSNSRHYQIFSNALEVNANTNLNNVLIDAGNAYPNGIVIGPTTYDASLTYGNINFCNVKVVNSTNRSILAPSETVDYSIVNATNCYFEQTVSAKIVMSNTHCTINDNVKFAYSDNVLATVQPEPNWANYTSSVPKVAKRCGNKVYISAWLRKISTASEGETLFSVTNCLPSEERLIVGYVSNNGSDYKPILLAVGTTGKISIKKKCQSTDLTTAPIDILFSGFYEL